MNQKIIKSILTGFTVFCLCWINDSYGQNRFQAVYGNNQFNESKITHDSGFILCGQNGTGPAVDIKVVRTNSAGDIVWTRILGDAPSDWGISLDNVFDEGYIIAGHTLSAGAGNQDGILVRMDTSGNVLWSKTYGLSGIDQFNSVKTLPDSGFIICGATTSFGTGNYDMYIIRTNNLGDTLWTKVIGGPSFERAYSCIQTIDGGFIISGMTGSFPDFSSNIMVVKLNASGNMIWAKAYAGVSEEESFSIKQTDDNGFIIAGYVDASPPLEGEFMLLKTDEIGDIQWARLYGGTGDERAYSVIQTTDNGFALTGYSYNSVSTNTSIALLKTDSTGNLQWSKNYQYSVGLAWGYHILQMQDEGYAITASAGGARLIRTDTTGNSECPDLNSTYQSSVVSFNAVSVNPAFSYGGLVNIYNIPVNSGPNTALFCSITSDNMPGENELSFSLYPNPGSDYVSLLFATKPEPYDNVEIINLTGEVVLKSGINKTKLYHQLDVSKLSSGSYLILLNSNGGNVYRSKLNIVR